MRENAVSTSRPCGRRDWPRDTGCDSVGSSSVHGDRERAREEGKDGGDESIRAACGGIVSSSQSEAPAVALSGGERANAEAGMVFLDESIVACGMRDGEWRGVVCLHECEWRQKTEGGSATVTFLGGVGLCKQ